MERAEVEALIDEKLAEVFGRPEPEEKRGYGREEQKAAKLLAGLRVKQAIEARRRADSKCPA